MLKTNNTSLLSRVSSFNLIELSTQHNALYDLNTSASNAIYMKRSLRAVVLLILLV